LRVKEWNGGLCTKVARENVPCSHNLHLTTRMSIRVLLRYRCTGWYENLIMEG